MIAWTGIEHFRLGRFDPPPPANEPEDSVVCVASCSYSISVVAVAFTLWIIFMQIYLLESCFRYASL